MSLHQSIPQKIKVELHNNALVLDITYPSFDPFDDESNISLAFTKSEVKKLCNYYNVKIEELLLAVSNHYETYNSPKLFQEFLDKRGIHGTLSSTAPLINS